MLIEALAIAGGSILSGAAAYRFGKRRVAPAQEDEPGLPHRHRSWKKDMGTGVYACSECGFRYLHGRPPKP